MAREFAEAFYKSQAWVNTRRAYAKSKSNLCEECLSKGLYKQGRIVHHKVPLTPENINNPDITLSWDNLKLVCYECHAEEHGYNKTCYKFDEYGNVIER